MKIENALKEVWRWKEENSRQTQLLSFAELVAYEKKTMDEIQEQFGIRFRKKKTSGQEHSKNRLKEL